MSDDKHKDPADCPTWHDGCNCTVETCVNLSKLLDEEEAHVRDLEAQFAAERAKWPELKETLRELADRRSFDACKSHDERCENTAYKEALADVLLRLDRLDHAPVDVVRVTIKYDRDNNWYDLLNDDGVCVCDDYEGQTMYLVRVKEHP